jgi:hypothetical protein
MDKIMKCIKIDVVSRTVYEIEIEGGLQSMYDAMGLECEMIEKGFYLPIVSAVESKSHMDTCFVDEESLIKGDGYVKGAFSFQAAKGNVYGPFFNNGLIVGCDSEGESQSHRQIFETIKNAVQFYEIENTDI